MLVIKLPIKNRIRQYKFEVEEKSCTAWKLITVLMRIVCSYSATQNSTENCTELQKNPTEYNVA